MGFIGAALVFCFARGPWQKGWLGWSEGWGLRRRDLMPQDGDEEKVDAVRVGSAKVEILKEKVVDGMAADAVRRHERERNIGESRKS